LDAEPPTELMVAMVVAKAGKFEQDQWLAGIFGRTGEIERTVTERHRAGGRRVGL